MLNSTQSNQSVEFEYGF